MKKLVLEGTNKTPKIILNSDIDIYDIKGISIPEDARGFYRHIIDWWNDYLATQTKGLTLVLELTYFNTASSKCILDMFRVLEKIQEKTDNVTVEWYCDADDEDMIEVIEDYQNLVTKLNFVLKTK